MRFCQLIEYIAREVFFFKNHTGNEAGRLVPGLFFFLKKLLVRYMQLVCNLVSINFDNPQLGIP